MGKDINKLIASGYVGKAELKTFSNDKSVLNFSVASNKPKKVNDVWGNITTWFNCQLWNPSDYDKSNIDKGLYVTVVGSLNSNAKDNVTYWSVLVDNVVYQAPKGNAKTKDTDNKNDFEDNDVPF